MPCTCNSASPWIEHPGPYLGVYSQMSLGVSCQFESRHGSIEPSRIGMYDRVQIGESLTACSVIYWSTYSEVYVLAISECTSSAKDISVWAEWLCKSGRALWEPSEPPQWRITPCPASIPLVALHIALRSLFHQFFSFCRCSISNEHSGLVANCDRMSAWVHWVRACIGIAMLWVTLRKSLLAFLLPAREMQFSLY